LLSPHGFFQAQTARKLVFGLTGRAYDTPSDPLVGWEGGHSVPIRFPLDAFGVLMSAPRASWFIWTPFRKSWIRPWLNTKLSLAAIRRRYHIVSPLLRQTIDRHQAVGHHHTSCCCHHFLCSIDRYRLRSLPGSLSL